MAGIADVDGRPVDRDAYAQDLQQRLDDERGGRRPILNDAETTVIAELLDELAAVYPGETLGTLARELSVRLWDRLGI